jgi:septum formation protein
MLSKAENPENPDLTVSYRLRSWRTVKTDIKIILASSSPFRRELLQRLNLEFSVISPDIDETPNQGEVPEDLVLRLAEKKAAKIAENTEDSIIIASDQVACLGPVTLGKPMEHDVAVKQLQKMRGKTVIFYTSLFVLDTYSKRHKTTRVDNHVQFRDYTDEEIERYLQKELPYHCAGSFKSEKLGISLIKEISGPDPSALIGLPLIQLSEILREFGLQIP